MPDAIPNPVDKQGALLRSALIMEADLMETRYWIARLRRLHDVWIEAAQAQSDLAATEVARADARLRDGQSLGMTRAAGELDMLIRELVAAAARQLRS